MIGTLARLAVMFVASGPQPYSVTVVSPGPGRPRLVLAPRDADTAALVVQFPAGSVDDDNRPGLTRLAQHLLIEGNRRNRYDELVTALFAADAELRIETGLRDCSFSLVANRRDFPALAKILLTSVLAPDLNSSALGPSAERARLDAREPGKGRDLITIVGAAVVDDGRFRNEPYGDRHVIESLTIDDIREHLAGPLRPAGATVFATGAFDPAWMRRLVGGFSGPRAVRQDEAKVSLPFAQQIPSTRDLRILGQRVEISDARTSAAARVLAEMLDVRVSRQLRLKGIGYSAGATLESTPWLDFVLMVVPARDGPALDIGHFLEAEVARVRTGEFSDDELLRAKGHVRAALAEVDASPEALVHELASRTGPLQAWYGPELIAALATLDRKAFVTLVTPWLADSASMQILYSRNASRQGAIPSSSGGRR